MALTNDQITAQNFKDFYDQIRPYLNSGAHDAFLPIGTIIPLMGNTPPQNTLKCDGTTYNISDYTELAAYFTGQFGSVNYFGGNGTTTFAIPDLRGEFLRGTGTNGHTGQGSGSNVGVHQDSTSFPNFFGSTGTTGTIDMAKASVTNRDTSTGSGKARYSSASDTGSNYDVSFTARPTNTSVLYCIVYKNIYADMQDFFSAGAGIDIDANNVVSTDNMPAEDMSEIIFPKPSVQTKQSSYDLLGSTTTQEGSIPYPSNALDYTFLLLKVNMVNNGTELNRGNQILIPTIEIMMDEHNYMEVMAGQSSPVSGGGNSVNIFADFSKTAVGYIYVGWIGQALSNPTFIARLYGIK